MTMDDEAGQARGVISSALKGFNNTEDMVEHALEELRKTGDVAGSIVAGAFMDLKINGGDGGDG